VFILISPTAEMAEAATQSNSRARVNKSTTTLRYDDLDSTEVSTILYSRKTICAHRFECKALGSRNNDGVAMGDDRPD